MRAARAERSASRGAARGLLTHESSASAASVRWQRLGGWQAAATEAGVINQDSDETLPGSTPTPTRPMSSVPAGGRWGGANPHGCD